jgi:hypothetical protein
MKSPAKHTNVIAHRSENDTCLRSRIFIMLRHFLYELVSWNGVFNCTRKLLSSNFGRDIDRFNWKVLFPSVRKDKCWPVASNLAARASSHILFSSSLFCYPTAVHCTSVNLHAASTNVTAFWRLFLVTCHSDRGQPAEDVCWSEAVDVWHSVVVSGLPPKLNLKRLTDSRDKL